MEIKLDIEKLDKKVVPEFSVLFSNPRELRLFRNFVVTQAKIKNNYFKVISEYKTKSEPEMIDYFMKYSVDLSNIEGNFAFIYYLIYLLPDKTEKFFLEPEMILSLDYINQINNIYSGFGSDSTFGEEGLLNDKIKKFIDSKDDKKVKDIRNLFDKLRKYYPENINLIYLLLQNDLHSLLDIFKVQNIFEHNLGNYPNNYSRNIQKIYEEFNSDWTYFFLVLKEAIISRIRTRGYMYGYHMMFLESDSWLKDKNILKDYKLNLLIFLSEVIQYNEFMYSLTDTIHSHTGGIGDFINPPYQKIFTYNQAPYSFSKSLEGEYIIKILNKILDKCNENILRQDSNIEKYGGLIYQLSFNFNGILRLFEVSELKNIMESNRLKKSFWFVSSVATFNDHKQENLVDYSYYFLEFKELIELWNKPQKEIYRQYFRLPYVDKYVYFDENEIYEIIDKLFRELSFDNETALNVKLESIDTMFYMLLSKKLYEKKDIEEIFKEFEQKIMNLMPIIDSKQKKKKFNYVPYIKKHMDKLIELLNTSKKL